MNPVALGLESKEVADSQIKNSSAINTKHSAAAVRLNTGSGWCVQRADETFLIIDFGQLITISKMASQGAYYNDQPSFTANYSTSFSYSGTKWHDYTEDGKPKVMCNCSCYLRKYYIIQLFTIRGRLK